MASGAEPSLGLAIVHHTACGMARFAEPEVAAAITSHFGSDEVVMTYSIPSPAESLAADLERLRANSVVPRGLQVSGHIYDVTTGQLAEEFAPTALD